jgi:ribulose-5-phosphate 4-epimerase/fuculose-1-phosphate aldolase
MSPSSLAEPKVLQDLVIANRILANEGVLDAFGHVSVRHPESRDQYLIARSLGPELVTESDIQRFTLDGQAVVDDPRPAYAERAIHGAIYEARPDVLAVCHSHSPSVIPFGVTGTRLRPIFHMAGLIGSQAPVWDIADDFGTTDMLVRVMEHGRSLARTLGSGRIALMRGHGCVVAGPGLRQVVMTCVYAEQNARLQKGAIALGQVRYLSDEEIALTGEMLLNPLASERAWGCWAARVGFPE